MANLTKSEPFFEVEVAQAEDLTVHGGLVALDALARQYGLWEKLPARGGSKDRGGAKFRSFCLVWSVDRDYHGS